MPIVRKVTLAQIERVKPGDPGNFYSHEPETALLQAVKSRRMVTFEFAPEDATTHAALANSIKPLPGHSIASFKVMCDPDELDAMELEAEYEIVIRPLTE